ncbi:hypothetical protein GRI97_15725 [Altererythrobacter xixiisoli]|uniref:Uncharacterized protein n=1 Tax=Croceibacterium xixiisoli TaxID=1476466 RepID=A0A6I4TZ88_9SPHN|nr:hypothetical protein [Croceibacterium xixiisoli]MXP00440.1 hypothetical protein [Croceibacterium xixiisoli]
MWVELEQFLATDADGKQYTVKAFQRQVIYHTRSGEPWTRKGRISHRLMDGRPIEIVEGESAPAFRIVDGGQVIRRV